MIFVSNPSILFKKSQVVQGFLFFVFFLLSLKLTVLSTVVFLFPKCVFCQWEKLFSEKEGVCVCVCVCVRACMHRRERQIEGHIEKEREGCVCVSLCVCLCVFTDLLAENPAFTFSRPFRSNCYLCLCVIYLQEIADRFKY